MKGILSKTLGVVTCFSVAGALAVIAASKWIILAYGRSFAAGRPVLVIMALASICAPLTLIVNQFLASLSRMWYAALFSALWAGLYVGMSWTLVPRFGALGMVSALFGAYLVTSAVSVAFVTALVRKPEKAV
jgi:O-antigen/teichoic acid export membrane protein